MKSKKIKLNTASLYYGREDIKIKRIIFVILIISVICLLIGCSNDTDDIKIENNLDIDNISHLKFYMIPGLHFEESVDIDENRIVLFTESDIESFDWNSQTIIFNKSFLQNIDESYKEEINSFMYGGSKVLGAGMYDTFAVYLDDYKLYEGYFQQDAYSSFAVIGVVIHDVPDGIQIGYTLADKNDDIRKNEDLYKFLDNKNLIKK